MQFQAYVSGYAYLHCTKTAQSNYKICHPSVKRRGGTVLQFKKIVKSSDFLIFILHILDKIGF